MQDVRAFANGTEHRFMRCPKPDFSTLHKYWNHELEMKKKNTGKV